MNNHLNRIQEHLEHYPRLRPLLECVCDGLNRRGTPIGSLKLGEHLDRIQEIEPLRLLFDHAITASRNGTVTLHFDRIASYTDSATLEVFLSALYTAVGIPRENRPAQRLESENDTNMLLARLCQQFPSFMFLHEAQANRSEYWKKRVAKDGASTVQELLERAFRIVKYLEEPHDAVTFSDLGARLFGDSKILRGGELQTIAGEFLSLLDNSNTNQDSISRAEAWRRRNVVNNPSAIKVTIFGPLVYWKNGKEFDWIYQLWECGETATLSQGNIAGIERCELRMDLKNITIPIITCENESPFCRLSLQREHGIIIYTEGYPNAVVLELMRLLRLLNLPARHWGDSDLDGLRIADILNRIHPLSLWRCNLPELQRLQTCLKPLSLKAKESASTFLLNHPEFPFASELSYTIQNGWLEQESWH